MTAQYTMSPDGVVHLMASGQGNEFTFCSRPTDGDEECEGFDPQPSNGPATCRKCREAFDETKDSMAGAWWRLP